MTEYEQKLYDVIADWWDKINPPPVDRDGERNKILDIIHLVKSISEIDDAPWLNTTYGGFMTGAEVGFTTWFNEIYGVYSHRCEWFFGDCEVEDVKTRKDLLYKWIHAAYCAGYEEKGVPTFEVVKND